MKFRLLSGSPRRRVLSFFSSHACKRSRGKRRRVFERLERRDMLAAAVWNNAAWPVDVSGDSPGNVDPLDVLMIINEINSPAFADPVTRRLPKQVDGLSQVPFVDVSCNGFVDPLDALIVINHINSVGIGSGGAPVTSGGVFSSASCSPQLIEGADFVSQWTKPLIVPSGVSSLEILIEPPQFDSSSQGTIKDAFEIEVVDQDGVPILASIQFDHDSLLNWTEGYEPRSASGVTWETESSSGLITAIINLSQVPVGTALSAQTRLVNNDSDDQSSVVIRGMQFSNRTSNFNAATSPSNLARSEGVDPVDLSQLSDVTSSVRLNYGQTSLSSSNDELIVEAWVTNAGSLGIRDRLVAVVDRFSTLDTDLLHPDGRLPDGRAFLDFTAWLPGDRLTSDQSTLAREIRFRHLSEDRFQYGVRFYALLNAAPSDFTSIPLTEIGAGAEYRYKAQAKDPDGDALRFSLVVAPSNSSIDATTGAVRWNPTNSDLGTTRWIVRATDPDGLFVEQPFDVTVVESLQNRPPNFTTVPVIDALASSGFEIATVPIGNQPVAAAILNGFQGNRLVVANAGDQRIGVYEPSLSDEYAEDFSVSTGEPKPNGLVLRSGIDVNLGLPHFCKLAIATLCSA